MFAFFIISLLIGLPIGIVLILKDNKLEADGKKSFKFMLAVGLAVLPIILLSIILIKAWLNSST